jgi:hypothetical protein
MALHFFVKPLYSKCIKVALPRCFTRALSEPGLGISPSTIPGQRFRGKNQKQRQSGQLATKQRQLRHGDRRCSLRSCCAAISGACFSWGSKTQTSNRITNGVGVSDSTKEMTASRISFSTSLLSRIIMPSCRRCFFGRLATGNMTFAFCFIGLLGPLA